MQGGSWDASSLVSNFNTMSLNPPSSAEWYADFGTGSHMVNNAGILSSFHPPSSSSPSSIIVGNGALLPITSVGSHSFATDRRPPILSNVLVSPSIIKNLIYVHRFTTDNNCSIKFDPFGLSVKDLQMRSVITRCNSTSHLYPFFPPTPANLVALTAAPSPSTLWHRRLGHIGHEALSKLLSSNAISCNKHHNDHVCHACQLGRHVRLPFSMSNSRALHPFDLIHCDLWTSPVVSVSGYKYYLIILDDCTHYTWTFPLRLKSKTFGVLSHFFSYVHMQFTTPIKAVQCDNGHEFDNSSACTLFLIHGVVLRMSCPYTSQQNGRVEHTLRTLNNIVRSLLFQASLSSVY
jgi:histone deacetylase 1/2